MSYSGRSGRSLPESEQGGKKIRVSRLAYLLLKRYARARGMSGLVEDLVVAHCAALEANETIDEAHRRIRREAQQEARAQRLAEIRRAREARRAARANESPNRKGNA